MDKLERLAQDADTPRGLLAAVGAWAEYEGLEQLVEEIYRQRRDAHDRPVVPER